MLTIYYSFFNWNLLKPGSFHFSGLDNYSALLTNESIRTAVLNTVVLTVAVIALKERAEVGSDELAAWCRDAGLPTIKVPGAWEFMPSLPKNAVGKIAKRELRDRFWSGERSI